MIWTPYATTKSTYIVCKILQGAFMSPIEALYEISVADVFFAHERGSYIGLYGFFVGGGSFFASFIAGFIADGQGEHLYYPRIHRN
jgi:MFS family permease